MYIDLGFGYKVWSFVKTHYIALLIYVFYLEIKFTLRAYEDAFPVKFEPQNLWENARYGLVNP